MSTLSLFLPPFASDYTGAASALFELDCLVAINDGSCCTSNFASYDEPRWQSMRKQTLCTNLRMKDTVFGIDERIVEQLGEAARELDAHRIVVLGTPVPAVIGTDMAGLAAELEDATGIPSFGIDTTGFSTYESGIDKAFDLVLELAKHADAPDCGESFVNILGATPLDFGTDSARMLSSLFEQEGIAIGAQAFMGIDEASLGALRCASCNIAISYAGISAAQKIEQEFGTPYLACSFTTSQETRATLDLVRRIMNGAQPVRHEPTRATSGRRILIVGDQVIGNSLRNAIRRQPGLTNVTIHVASFFGLHRRHEENGDTSLSSESHLARLLKEGGYDVVVGDPLLLRMPMLDEGRFVSLVHPAVSSRLYRGQEPRAGSRDLDDKAKAVSDIVARL